MVSKIGWELGLIGGILGLVSLVLPWVPWAMITASTTSAQTAVGISSIQLIQTSSSVLVLGFYVYGIGCIVAFMRPHGGFVMLAGTGFVALGTWGTYSFRYSGVTVNLSLSPGIGVGLAFVASVIAIVGVAASQNEFIPRFALRGVPRGANLPKAPPVCSSCGLVQVRVQAHCSRCGAELG